MSSILLLVAGLIIYGASFACVYAIMNLVRKLISLGGCGACRPAYLLFVFSAVAAIIGYIFVPQSVSLFQFMVSGIRKYSIINRFLTIPDMICSDFLDEPLLKVGAGIICALIGSIPPGARHTWESGTLGFLVPVIIIFYPIWFASAMFVTMFGLMALIIAFALGAILCFTFSPAEYVLAIFFFE